ncbi:hypothetical protein OXPF_39360 [Oxobacter pfennigii]|uniref:Phage-related minor tail protein n=1 Tax=Oxobacter pfennigii TaxID=36849 RepID=A0A0P8W417_9CLOT|nr:hypothetical protein [Oxobacter pfennigii]KPU42157.1 hypothetical protein OXPF_39360 [Oxobacter pfennigii]
MASKKELRALITLAGKIDPSLSAAMAKASKLNSNMAKESTKSAGVMSKTWDIAKGVLVGNILTKGVSMVVSGLKTVGTQGIQLASDLTEVQNVVDTTFGENGSKMINSWAQNALNAFGLSEMQAKKFNGTMGALLKSSGITGQSLVGMSENLTGLAGDMASFYNLDHEEAFTKIRAGISGETEPLKALGINMSVANLEAFALSKGIKTAYKNMDQASQVALRYGYLMEKSKDAQGDFAKTLDTSYANQKRLLATNFNQKIAQLATKSLPILTRGTKVLNDILAKIDAEKLGNMLAGFADKAFEVGERYMPLIIEGASKIPPILADVYNMGKGAADLIINYWPLVEPVLWGMAAGLTASKLAMLGLTAAEKGGMIISGLSKAWAIGSGALHMLMNGARLSTVAQWALNAASIAFPGVWVVAAIAGVATAGYMLWKNWDKVSVKLAEIWENIKGAFKAGVDWVVDKINKIPLVNIPMATTLDPKAPAVSSLSYISSPMPMFAEGGFTNKPSIFGEDGPEAAIPIKYRNPRSISILNQTAKAIGATSGGRHLPMININITVAGSTPQEQVTNIASSVKQALMDVLEEFQRDEERVAYG